MPVLDLLASPPVLFTLAMGLLLVLVRSPMPWTRTGGGVFLVLALVAAAVLLRQPHLRPLVLTADRLPVMFLLLLSAAALWVAFHQALHLPRDEEDDTADVWRGLSPEELLAGGATVLGVAVCAYGFGAPLAPVADFSQGTPDSAAPWFLLGLQDLRSYFDPWVPGVLLPVLAVAGLLLLPYLDRSAEAPRSRLDERRDVVLFFLFVWFLLALLPMAFGAWSLSSGDALARPFSEILWKVVLENPPRFVWLRELPGLLLAAAYFVVLPRQLPRWKPTRAIFGRYLKRLGRRRFNLGIAFVLIFLLIPLKMYGRWLAGVEYFIYLPELGLNF